MSANLRPSVPRAHSAPPYLRTSAPKSDMLSAESFGGAPEISQELYGEIEPCSAAANYSLPLPPERFASVAFGGKLALLSDDFTQLLAICGGRASDAEVFHNSSLRWLLRWSRLTVVVSSVPFRCPEPAFFDWARRFGVGALYDESGRALAAELPGKKLYFADRAAWEVALPSLLQSLFRPSGFAVLVSARAAQGRSLSLATVRAAQTSPRRSTSRPTSVRWLA